jgi:hypothetical protein
VNSKEENFLNTFVQITSKNWASGNVVTRYSVPQRENVLPKFAITRIVRVIVLVDASRPKQCILQDLFE